MLIDYYGDNYMKGLEMVSTGLVGASRLEIGLDERGMLFSDPGSIPGKSTKGETAANPQKCKLANRLFRLLGIG